MITEAPERACIGPLLDGVLRAQRADEEATSHPLIGVYAERVVEAACCCDVPLLWPVGDAASRLVGAAVLVGKGAVRARGWSAPITDQSVMLVATITTTPLEVIAASSHARALGARTVHACGIEVTGIEDVVDTLDGFICIADAASDASDRQRRSVATAGQVAA